MDEALGLGANMTVDDEIRASDRDRERVVEVLGEQTSQGRLTLTEFEERTARVYTARTWHELRALINDLPVRVSFGDGGSEPRPATQPRPDPLPGPVWRPARDLLPYLPYVLLGVAAMAVAFRLPAAAIVIPLLIVGRVVRGGSLRTLRHRRHHHHH